MIKIQQVYDYTLYTSGNGLYRTNDIKNNAIKTIIVINKEHKYTNFENTYYLNLNKEDMFNKTILLENIIKVNDIVDNNIKTGNVLIQCDDGLSQSIAFSVAFMIHLFEGGPPSNFYNYIVNKNKNKNINKVYLSILEEIYYKKEENLDCNYINQDYNNYNLDYNYMNQDYMYNPNYNHMYYGY